MSSSNTVNGKSLFEITIKNDQLAFVTRIVGELPEGLSDAFAQMRNDVGREFESARDESNKDLREATLHIVDLLQNEVKTAKQEVLSEVSTLKVSANLENVTKDLDKIKSSLCGIESELNDRKLKDGIIEKLKADIETVKENQGKILTELSTLKNMTGEMSSMLAGTRKDITQFRQKWDTNLESSSRTTKRRISVSSAGTPALKKMKKESSSLSSESEEEAKPATKPPTVKKPVVNGAAKKPAAADSSSESDTTEDDEDEKPKSKATPAKPAAAPAKPTAAAKKAESDSSEESSDEEPAPKTATKPSTPAAKPAVVVPAVKKPAAKPDSSSDDSSSEEEAPKGDEDFGFSPRGRGRGAPRGRGGDRGRGGRGGGESGGGFACYNCGDTGHRSGECPVRGPIKCFNRQEEGHMSKDCSKPRAEHGGRGGGRGGPRGGGGSCYRYGKEDHMSFDCDQPRTDFGGRGRGRGPPRGGRGRGTPRGGGRGGLYIDVSAGPTENKKMKFGDYE